MPHFDEIRGRCRDERLEKIPQPHLPWDWDEIERARGVELEEKPTFPEAAEPYSDDPYSPEPYRFSFEEDEEEDEDEEEL